MTDGEEGLDGSAFVHGPVALGGLFEREGEIEDVARVDVAVVDEVQVLWEEPRTGAGPLTPSGAATPR